jgi:RNA polymerase sigma-70 factor (ECF subfamily)
MKQPATVAACCGHGAGVTANEPRADAPLLVDADAHAFREFYDRYAEAVHGYFVRRGIDHHGALDLTAEKFAASWLSRSRFRDPGDGNAGPWLFGIARNMLSHAARHRSVAVAARERLGLLAEVRIVDPVAVTALDNIEQWSSELDDAMATLNGSARRALKLRVIHGISYETISEELGCTPLAARIKVSRALAELRIEVPNPQRGDADARRPDQPR